jgi:hypothetical protein
MCVHGGRRHSSDRRWNFVRERLSLESNHNDPIREGRSGYFATRDVVRKQRWKGVVATNEIYSKVASRRIPETLKHIPRNGVPIGGIWVAEVDRLDDASRLENHRWLTKSDLSRRHNKAASSNCRSDIRRNVAGLQYSWPGLKHGHQTRLARQNVVE